MKRINTVWDIHDRAKIKYRYKSGTSVPNPVLKRIICIETKAEYKSITDAALQLNISRSSINLQLRGKRNKAHGLTFEYID